MFSESKIALTPNKKSPDPLLVECHERYLRSLNNQAQCKIPHFEEFLILWNSYNSRCFLFFLPFFGLENTSYIFRIPQETIRRT